jgi:hypothetical protein
MIRTREEIMGSFGGKWLAQYSAAGLNEFREGWRDELYIRIMQGRFPGHTDVGIAQGQYTSGIGPWGSLYGTLSRDGRNWKGRYWGHPWTGTGTVPNADWWWFGGPSAPLPVEYISGEFWFQLSADGNTFTGVYNNFSDPTRRLYVWDGYKVCEEEVCTKPLPNKDFPRKHPTVVKLPPGF